MSGTLNFAGLPFFDVLIVAPRMIGGIIPDCAIEERGSDRTVITEHPVEQGASISDHAYLLPAEVTLRYAWSNSSGGSEDYSRATYDLLLALRAAREPFELVTGKRIYSNMLIASLDVTTDSSSEYALVTTVVCKEVIIVTTTITSIPSAKVSEKQNVTPEAKQGTQTPQQKPNSVLKNLPGLFRT